jgi:hypothetical protein
MRQVTATLATEVIEWSHSLLSFGKQPAPLVMFEAAERGGKVLVTIPNA